MYFVLAMETFLPFSADLRWLVIGLEHCLLGELDHKLSLLESSSLSLLTVGADFEELGQK